VAQGDQCFLLWDFHFRFKRFDTQTPQTIRGTSHLVFSEAGLVTLHRTTGTPPQELYGKLPLIGGLMRWLKKRRQQLTQLRSANTLQMSWAGRHWV